MAASTIVCLLMFVLAVFVSFWVFELIAGMNVGIPFSQALQQIGAAWSSQGTPGARWVLLLTVIGLCFRVGAIPLGVAFITGVWAFACGMCAPNQTAGILRVFKEILVVLCNFILRILGRCPLPSP